MIKFENVTKTYGSGLTALSNVSFQVDDREFVFFVGPSGSGKTTIFRLILRDLVPDSGNIFVDEHDLNKIKSGNVTQLRRKIGTVFQDLKLLWDKNIFDNVALSLWVLGKNEKEIKEEVKEKLDLVGLSDKENYFPAQLSGGELQRVAIARALAGDPKYILADEPTGNIDDANSWRIMKIFDKINKNGTTILMATHNTDIISSYKKKIIKLRIGNIV